MWIQSDITGGKKKSFNKNYRRIQQKVTLRDYNSRPLSTWSLFALEIA